jgi:soluble lytic murein transglycosylase
MSSVVGRAARILISTAALAAAALFLAWLVLRWQYPLRYEKEIAEACAQTGLSPALVCAVIHTERSFRPGAVSTGGARGLLQITQETYEWIRWRMGDTADYDALFNAGTNIRYGTYLLSYLNGEFDSTASALAAYHAGSANVKRWLSVPEYSADGKTLEKIPFDDTAKYVPRVLRTMEIYRTLYKKQLTQMR